jgi:hypothetical protein
MQGGLMVMSEDARKSPDLFELSLNCNSDEHTCGVIDEREATMLRHLIMAEIRKSNAPEWVAEELEKKMDCRRCGLNMQKKLLIMLP